MQQWERKEFRQCNYSNQRVFTLRCICKGLVPVSVRLNSNRKDISIGARNIIRRAERQLLQQRVKDINRLLQDNSEGIAVSKSRLFSLVTNPHIQQQCTEFIDKVREARFNMVTERQGGKFISLLNKSDLRENNTESINNRVWSSSNQVQVYRVENNSENNTENGNNMFSSNSNQAKVNLNSKCNSTTSKWVINLSSLPLTPAQVSLLSKGPNFSLLPNNPPNVEFISAIELACQKITEKDAQELRAEVNIMLRRAKPPNNNISREEKKALKEQSEDQDRMVLTADKGVALVVMDRKEYQEKVEGLLAKLAYRNIKADPTNKLKAQLIQKLRRIKRETNLCEGEYRSMYPTGCTAPKFYGLPKIHRPIVSSRGSVTYGVAKVIAKILKPPCRQVTTSYTKYQ